ncbi:endonuclease LCL3 [Acrasis kona]|uniref:Endonuclease LCL3 n=1 Tax=Acrasis kona TaxID=1008807 RepID=A0AAW2ZPG4_9EUKA
MESVLFLIAVRDYRDDATKQSLKSIMDDFILYSCKHQINIGKRDRAAIIKAYEASDYGQVQYLLDKAYEQLYAKLKSQSFRRYVERGTYKQFVKDEDTSLFQDLGVKIDQTPEWKLCLSSFSTASITNHDILYLIRLNEDLVKWVPLNNNSSISDKKYELDGFCNKQFMYKYSGELYFSAREALYALLDVRNLKDWVPLVTACEYVGYDGTRDYAVSKIYCDLRISCFMKKRFCYVISTVVYDTIRRCYIIIIKTTTGVNSRNRRNRGASRVVSVVCFFIYEIGEFKSRYSCLTCANMDLLPFVPSLFEKRYNKKFGLNLFKKWDALCKRRGEEHGHCKPNDSLNILETLDDFVSKYLSADNREKTWM